MNNKNISTNTLMERLEDNNRQIQILVSQFVSENETSICTVVANNTNEKMIRQLLITKQDIMSIIRNRKKENEEIEKILLSLMQK